MQSLLLTMVAINNAIGTFGDNDFVICGIFGNINNAGKNEICGYGSGGGTMISHDRFSTNVLTTTTTMHLPFLAIHCSMLGENLVAVRILEMTMSGWGWHWSRTMQSRWNTSLSSCPSPGYAHYLCCGMRWPVAMVIFVAPSWESLALGGGVELGEGMTKTTTDTTTRCHPSIPTQRCHTMQ
jgi:hypothetical protein